MNTNPITRRLTRDTSYKPTAKSYQQELSESEIMKKLEDYTRVKSEDVYQIPLNTHVRYFSTNPKTGKKEFRLGGIITKFGDNGEYLVLSNGTLSWSVQIKNTTFYKKQTISEIKESVEKKASVDIDKILEENKKLKKVIKEIKEESKKKKK